MGIANLNEFDLTEINQLNQSELGYAYSLEKTKLRFNSLINQPKHHVLVGYRDDQTNKIIGYIHAEVYEELYCDPLLNVLALAVKEEYQRHGIGKQLLQWLETEARARGMHGIRLNSGLKRVNAHDFYRAAGYEEIKTQKKFQKTWNPK
ncbi:histone acetyltransferase HPA2 [Fructobacillus pseudoficulneus]|uniref:Histone acetyltransferase HPA2 n=1 Tax=Fructobacillus pseudoficulneus TaxID=220714 RepID=A0A3F3GZV8_9LACO|nr:GNAT family N-acetyltransferase [Fructobacillus pseudoficulneus]GAP03422.1 histone acetyltransferase HPA2 [Fructobacillus pseudoficulneus]SEH46455.1 Ribosomal protein S18 acetylase RimI [Fructobacillus pseudoficulneus]